MPLNIEYPNFQQNMSLYTSCGIFQILDITKKKNLEPFETFRDIPQLVSDDIFCSRNQQTLCLGHKKSLSLLRCKWARPCAASSTPLSRWSLQPCYVETYFPVCIIKCPSKRLHSPYHQPATISRLIYILRQVVQSQFSPKN